jgi:hypothetical protein
MYGQRRPSSHYAPLVCTIGCWARAACLQMADKCVPAAVGFAARLCALMRSRLY